MSKLFFYLEENHLATSKFTKMYNKFIVYFHLLLNRVVYKKTGRQKHNFHSSKKCILGVYSITSAVNK